MKMSLPVTMHLCAALAFGFTGCSHKDAVSKDLDQAAREMEKASSGQAPAPAAAQPSPSVPSPQAPPAPAAESQPPPAQQLSQALAVYKSGDYEDAVTRLQKLRATPALSPEQAIALQKAMSSVMTDIYARAAKGDPRAKQALKEYQEWQTGQRTK